MIVLDTHVFIWWVDDSKKLSPKAKKEIENTLKKDSQLLISVMSVWEIYLLAAKNRIGFVHGVDEWIEKTSQIPHIEFVPITIDIAAQSVNLPGEFHKDPADRMIVATARKYKAPLITIDKKILSYSHVQAIW